VTVSASAAEPAECRTSEKRSPLAYLLHALNQPLTGLQCALELAAAAPREPQRDLQTLREALTLTGRMRTIVEALNQIAELQNRPMPHLEIFDLQDLLRNAVEDLRPVAGTKHLRVSLACSATIRVQADRKHISEFLFRMLDAVLGEALSRTEIRIEASLQAQNAQLSVAWTATPDPEHAALSRSQLALLMVRAGWEQVGANWTLDNRDFRRRCTVSLPLLQEQNLSDWEI